MPRLPTPGGDNGNWGDILNEYLQVSHAPNGTLKGNTVGSSQLQVGAIGNSHLQDASVQTNSLKEGAVTRPKLSDAIQDELDSKLENVTGHLAAGSNITLTGLGTSASPYEISAANSGGDVTGPGSSAINAVARFSGVSGKVVKDSSLTIDDSGRLGIGTTSPTHALSFPTASTGIAIYNTADQTTNFERMRLYWSSNTFYMLTEAGGTGGARNLTVGTANRRLVVTDTPTTAGVYQFGYATSTANHTNTVISGSWTASSGTGTGLAIQPTINQSGTAGYTAFVVNPNETTTGSGGKLLADFQVGGASKTRIDNTGSHTLSSGAGMTFYNTTDESTNFERLIMGWSSNTFGIATSSGGTGSGRSIALQNNIVFRTSSPSGQVSISGATATVGAVGLAINNVYSQASGTAIAINLSPTVNQSGTAGYTSLLVNPTETATGSGSKLLADFQVGGASKFKIANDGLVTATNRITNVSDPTAAQDVATKNYVDTTRFEVLQAMGNVTGATNVNLSLAPNFSMTLTGNTTLTFTNVPTGSKVVAVTLYVTQDATGSRTLEITGRKGAFGANALANLSATAGAVDEIIARTLDGGATWIVSMGAQSIS